MTALRDVETGLHHFRQRVLVVAVVVACAFALLAARLVYLQVVRHDDFMEQAEANRTGIVPIVPNRGVIMDRNGVVLATNYSAYTLEIAPARVGAPLDQVIDELATVIDIQPRDRRRFRKLRDEFRAMDSIPIRTRLSDTEVARFAAQRFRFPGVEIKARLFRHYPWGELGSHVVGYIGRINQAEKAAIEEWPEDDQANYRGTEYIGKLGVEQAYERTLHGITGVDQVEKSAGGRAVRRLASTPATPGHAVHLSIDIKLQKLVEDRYGDRRGALVALDTPNRALRGTYPPGSTYKPFMGLAALASGKRNASTIVNDGGSWTFGGHVFRSHGDKALGAVDLHRSIVQSSNVYYYTLANELGVDAMHDFMKPLGFGQVTGIDIPGEVRGVLPSQAWKRATYKRPEQKKWYAGETISLGIGQGYNSFTMLQLAQATAIVANNGIKHRPHLVLATEDPVTHERRRIERTEAEDLGLQAEHVAAVRRAMVAVTQEGTSTRVFAGAGYLSGGKTGTAQAVTIGQKDKYNASKLEEHQRDHSLYIAFAPADQPTIALAVIVENAGFGAASAAPIARRVFDYWLMNQYPTPEDIAATQKGQSAAPIGKPLDAREAAWPPRPAP